jgi:hypothetical protein
LNVHDGDAFSLAKFLPDGAFTLFDVGIGKSRTTGNDAYGDRKGKKVAGGSSVLSM